MPFVIRDAQMEVLAEPLLEAFSVRMMRHVRRVFPQATSVMTDDEVRGLVRDGIERSRAYGIRRETDVALFIDLLLGIGTDFDDRPECAWIRTILDRREQSGMLRMQLIYDELPQKTR